MENSDILCKEGEDKPVRRAVVVGATSGIGREVALLLAERGWRVGVAGRREERLEALVAAHANIVARRRIDVTDEEAEEGLLALVGQLGGMDLYLHSSGIGWQNETLDAEKELRTVETNGLGFVRMVGAAYRWMAANGGGRIAAITSIAGTKGLGAAPAYSSTKRFQRHYLECLAQQARMRRLPIRLTDIRPGFVATDLIAGSHYPMQLTAASVARSIVGAAEKGKEVATIDWHYRLLVAVWRLVPRWLWVRMRVG